jgi:hypothetical protein
MNNETPNRSLGNILSWIFSVFFFFGGISELTGKEPMFGLTFIILSLYLIPEITQLISKKINVNLSGWRKLVGFGLIFFGMAIISGAITVDDPIESNSIISETNFVDETSQDSESKSERLPQTEEAIEVITEELEEERNEEKLLIEQLNREIQSLDGEIEMLSMSHDNIISLGFVAGLFDAWADMIQQGEQSTNAEVNKLAGILKKKVSNAQAREFPELRHDYGNIMKQLVWEHDVDLKVYGNGNGIIELTGYMFTSNGNIKEMHVSMLPMLKKLRFDQARYKWYEYDDEYTYYQLKSTLDTLIIPTE